MASTEEEWRVILLTNQWRGKHGLPPLQADARLRNAALALAADLDRNTGLPRSSRLTDQLATHGRLSHVNCASDMAAGPFTAEDVFRYWKQDNKGVRRNMSGDFDAIGVANIDQQWVRVYAQLGDRLDKRYAQKPPHHTVAPVVASKPKPAPSPVSPPRTVVPPIAARLTPESQQVLESRYFITDIEFIGRGGFGTVYKAMIKGKGRALKVPNAQVDDAIAFKHEIEMLQQLKHPNIVRVLGGSFEPPLVFMEMELMDMNLDECIHKPGQPMPQSVALEFIKEVATGLDFLHRQNPPIIHRDVKPSNLLVDHKGNLKVADFGLARIKQHTQYHLTAAEGGTPAYMAPECFEGLRLTEKVDVYALGVVLWECVTKQRPWDDPNVNRFAISHKVTSGNRPSTTPQNEPRVAAPKVWPLIQRCWAQKHQDRPTCIEVLAIIQELQKDDDLAPASVSRGSRTRGG